MAEVTTELDERFSDPEAEPTPWEETERTLREAQLFWISTVRRDGRPHVTPLVAVWHDGALHFCTGPGEQKAVNLEANPRVALTTGCNSWQDGLDVDRRGRGRACDRRGEAGRAGARLARKVGRLLEVRAGRRWVPPQRWRGHRSRLRRACRAKVLAFGKGGFSHTRHRFLRAPRAAEGA